MVLAIVVLCEACSRLPKVDAISLATGLVFFTCATPIAAWTVGGLEQPLVAVLLMGALLAYTSAIRHDYDTRTGVVLGVLLGMLCLTRPDGPLFTVSLAAAMCLGRILKTQRWSWSFALTFITIPALCYLGQLAFRLMYYHAWVPNTALVKIAFTWSHVVWGRQYVVDGLFSLGPLSWLAIVCLLLGTLHPTSRKQFLPLLTTFLFWLLYLVVIGGDIFPAHRHFTPVVVVLTLAIVEGLCRVYAIVTKEVNRPAHLVVGIVALFPAYIYEQVTNVGSHYAHTERWEWDGLLLGEKLKQAFSEGEPLIAVTAAGCLPYGTHFASLDMLGLNDYYIPRHVTYGIGSGALGHEMGDCAYVLRRQPDIIIWDLGGPPPTGSICNTDVYRFGLDFENSREFEEEYVRSGHVQTGERRLT